jgi:hypothetical protein
MIDDIVHRRDLRAVLGRLLRIYGQCAEVETVEQSAANK